MLKFELRDYREYFLRLREKDKVLRFFKCFWIKFGRILINLKKNLGKFLSVDYVHEGSDLPLVIFLEDFF